MLPNTRRLMCLMIRQNFSKLCEEAINKQINIELNLCHQYLAMAYHFDRSDVALPGVCNFFKNASMEEREHAERLMDYMNKRGGHIILKEIPEPNCEFESLKDAFLLALKMEMETNECLLQLHTVAGKENDPNLQDLIDEYLKEQVNGQKQLADYISQVERCNMELGDYIFDHNLKNGGIHN